MALPLKVIRSLWGPDASLDACAGLVQVKYARLEKGERRWWKAGSAFLVVHVPSWRLLLAVHRCTARHSIKTACIFLAA